ncbi:scp-like extracellular protein [Zymoseptoria brevis]|uniref:Scp-like extracellular protein n=1 Tax=Zymoseptoria brevis TaxID=1047168 RepID=A0A0F4GRR0_9PEZI|nr:scp-like extracellular protein [Zymoseptoria brevis]
MRSVFAVAALAAGALAVPYAEKRGLEAYIDDIVYETQVVTVTAYNNGNGPAPAAITSAAAAPAPHYGHKNPPAPAPAATSAAPAPPPSYQAPPAYQAPAAPASSAPASSGSQGSAEKPTDYKSKVVYFHNMVRSNHSCSTVEWDEGLYNCAKEIASSCVYAHNVDAQGGGYGQNIAAGVDADNIGSVLIDMFYNAEMPLYTYYGHEPDMSGFEQWGHGTQMVWKSTTHVACATQYCPNGLANTGSGVSPWFTVCNYKGPGNYAGQFADNVLAPLGHPSISNDNPGY